MAESTYRVTYERDERQAYRVGARVAVDPMNRLFRTVGPDPSTGEYLVMRCARVGGVGWKVLRVSLGHVSLPGIDAAPFTDAPPYTLIGDDRG